MSNERLERIKERVNYHSHLDDDIEWLIEQAERVQELEELNRILSSDKSMFIEELVREQQQNQRYREAIEKIKNKVSQQLEGLDAEEEMERVIKLSELMSISIEALGCEG